MDLCATPAVELARLIRARELSAAELLAAVLARIADANPAVNAIVTLAAEQATAAAAALDAQAARGSFAGPLHGLPIAVKDLAFASFLADGGYEVLALPTVQVVPFPVEQEWVTEINGEPMTTYIDWMRSCSRITVTVHPAVSVPAGLTAAGLPVGLQLVGRYGADRQLLEIAAAIMDLAS
jgi:amidase